MKGGGHVRNDAPAAFLIAHEGRRDPVTPRERFDVERRGYAAQGQVDRGLNRPDGGFSNRLPFVKSFF
jgi:hypothetical protein